jgi:hypothetical protein
VSALYQLVVVFLWAILLEMNAVAILLRNAMNPPFASLQQFLVIRITSQLWCLFYLSELCNLSKCAHGSDRWLPSPEIAFAGQDGCNGRFNSANIVTRILFESSRRPHVLFLYD